MKPLAPLLRVVMALGIALQVAACDPRDPASWTFNPFNSILNGGASITASITNPVTPGMLYQVETTANAVVSGLKIYKRACVAGEADKNCKTNIAAIQVYTRKLAVLLPQLRDFVLNGKQINAIDVYNQITDLISKAKKSADAVGVKTGG